MDEPKAPENFDQGERTRIRRTLHRYMAAQGFRVPTLHARILDSDPQHREIPMSTLQRFVRGDRRTNEFCVKVLRDFVDALPDEHMRDELDGLGDALEAFLLSPEDLAYAARWQLRERINEAEIPSVGVGDFNVYFHPTGEDFGIPYSTLTVEENRGHDFFKATEVVFNPRREWPLPENSPIRETYEGVCVCPGRFRFLLLRNTFSRMPKFYGLNSRTVDPGRGHALEAVFPHDTTWDSFNLLVEESGNDDS